jgi:uncharacterized delta-60 repeat protein
LDPSFGQGGKATTGFSSVAHDFGSDVAVQDDGKVVAVGGTYTGTTTGDDFALARYNPDGTLDKGFGSGGKVTTPIGAGSSSDFGYVVAIGADGKIVVAGYAYNGSNRDFAVARYKPDGTLDTTFGGDGIVMTSLGSGYDMARGVAVQGTKTVVVGHSDQGVTSTDFAVVRYSANGDLDSTFSEDGKVTTDFSSPQAPQDFADSVALQTDGKIVVAGHTFDGTHNGFGLARYNADGTLDTSFDADGKTITDFFGGNDEAHGVKLQEDGKIVAAGRTNYDFALARYFGGNDDAAPRVTTPTQTLQGATVLGLSAVPVRISWSATDTQGAVTRYELQRSTDGAAYTNVALPTPTTATLVQSLTPNRNYRYRVRATDDNGNTSFFKYGPRFTVDALQETSTSVAYSPTTAWTQQLLSGSYGGQVRYATAAGSTARLTFTGTNVAWVAPKGSNRGQAEVYLDNVKVATVDLSSPRTLPRRVVYAANGLSPSVNHTLEVKVLGTSGRPRVDVDAFVVVR